MSRVRTPPPTKDTYSTHDVARICCVTPTTVIRWIEDGLIPAFKTVGGHRRVRREDLERVCGERGIPFSAPTGNEVGRLLVVDDEPVVLELVRDVVKALSQKFEVEVAKDAFDAGRLVATFRPQLIILDLMMPGVDGFEVCTRLKADPATRNSEVIAITGYYTEANMDRILAAGAVACLRKPLDVGEVRRRVIEAFKLDEAEGGAPTAAVPPTSAATTKVLLVTQNADFRARVRDELAHAPNTVEVLTAQSAADALVVAAAAPPQHVIVSLTMPEVVATRVIEQLADGEQKPQIIAVHDAPDERVRAEARAAGARMCLPTQMVAGSVRELLGV
ncbi:MAG: response regulator [Myxococcales bacterium FL481]|nr:MAG: response regulator [Myxococcales bacterium FL481]